MADKCKHIKNDGSKCGAYALKTGKFCYFHEPQNAEKRKAASIRGARTKANLSQEVLIGKLVEQAEIYEKEPLQINTLDDLQRFAEIQIRYVEENKAFSKLSGADRAEMRKWADFLLKLLIVRGLGAEQRIRQLEAIAQKHSAPFD